MDGFKEFTGKNLDEAIDQACTYYNTSRERLEIDIVQDSKSGIFGLVGARKAIIQAKRVELRNAVDHILGRSKKSTASEKASAHDKKRAEAKEKHGASHGKNMDESTEKGAKKHSEKSNDTKQTDKGQTDTKQTNTKQADKGQTANLDSDSPKSQTGRGAKARKERNERNERAERFPRARSEQHNKADNDGIAKEKHRPKSQHKAQNKQAHKADALPVNDEMHFDDMDETENVPRLPLESLDQERLNTVTLEAVRQLTRLIVGDVPMSMSLVEGRVSVHLECDENSGLLIGREGQTLAALQYITSRIVSRSMEAAVRVQLDAGDYRSRQDEKLNELALILAEKVRQTGKAHSTRPLSSYHRRLVHMALQNSPDLHTRSSGEGSLKRVIIQRKRT